MPCSTPFGITASLWVPWCAGSSGTRPCSAPRARRTGTCTQRPKASARRPGQVRASTGPRPSCSTPEGITASSMRPRGPHRSALDVLNARRHERVVERVGELVCPIAVAVLNALRHHRVVVDDCALRRAYESQCSTPFGITASSRPPDAWTLRSPDVLNALRHHRVVEGGSEYAAP